MNPRARKLLGPAAMLLAAAAMPALAGPVSTSSAVGGSSASVAGSSASSASSERSSERSSDSSSRTQRVAEGQYTIIDLLAVPERPGLVRLRLQAQDRPAADGEILLYLPRQTVEESRLSAGQTVAARQRPYGMEFAHADTQRAFYLVLDDDWWRELASNPVML
jgi:hypothetical protein